MRKLCLPICLLSCLFLVACSSSKAPEAASMVLLPHLSPALPQDETVDRGTLVLSVACHLRDYTNQELTIPIAIKSGAKLRLFEPAAELKVRCRRHGRQLVVEQLPAGTYRLHQWSLPVLADSDQAEAKTKPTLPLQPPFYFSIKPGITTYVGNLSVSQQEVVVEHTGHKTPEDASTPIEVSYTYPIVMSQKYGTSDIKRFKRQNKALADKPLRKASF